VIVRDSRNNVVGLVVMHDSGRALNYDRIARPRASTARAIVNAALVALLIAAAFVGCLAMVSDPVSEPAR
jgi:hypothetical protein